MRATTRVVACPDPYVSRESPNDLRLSGAHMRVRCSRGFGESWLVSRNMPGRYVFAEMRFNGPELALAGNR